MKVLLVHNRYQQPGGEDTVFEAERDLLRARGHEVVTYERDNAEIEDYGAGRRAGLALRTVWAADSRRALGALIAREEPAVAHFHNTFPLISPSGWAACRAAGVPVIQTLHNYRLLCAGALLERNGRPCEDCLGRRLPWPAVAHACYRDSRVQSAVNAGAHALHRLLGSWRSGADVYVALSEFARRTFERGGLPAERLVVKPNFVHPDPGQRHGDGSYALFVGRLAEEKGVATLLDAWRRLPAPLPLRVVGDGPLAAAVREAALAHREIELLGRLPLEKVLDELRGARFLVVPSLWYEGFPRVLAEASACGVPALVSRIGSLAEIVRDGETGLQVTPGDPDAWARAVGAAWGDRDACGFWGRAARERFESEYSAERAYEHMLEIYRRALTTRACAARFDAPAT